MTIASAGNRVSFNCNGVSTVFPVPLQSYLATDFDVLLTSATGTQTLLTLNSDYALAASSTDQPPKWTLTTLSVTPYPTGSTLQALINPDQVHQTQYVQGQAFPSAAVQTDFDRLTQMVQRLQDLSNRSIVAPDGDVNPILGLPIAISRSNTYPTFDVNGNLSVAKTLPSGTLSQGSIGSFLYPTLAGEVGVVSNVYSYGNVRRFGATGTGATDDTVAIKNAALSASALGGGAVYLPTGTYLWTSAVAAVLGAGVTIRGDGRYASVFTTNNVAAQFFNVTGTGASIRSVGFTSSVTNTSGTWVILAGTENSMEDWHMSGQFNGVTVTGVATKVRKFWFGANAGGGIDMIMLCGDASPTVSDGLWEAQSAPFPVSGLSLQNCTAGEFSRLDILTRGATVAVIPSNGQSCDDDSFSDCFFDSGVTGLFIQNTGTGAVSRFNCTNCWTGDNSGNGVSIVNAGSGVMAGFEFVQHSFCVNGGSGITTSGVVTGVRTLGGISAGNTGEGAFWNHAGDIQMIGTRVGATDGLNGNAAGGIALNAPLTRVNILGCDVSANAVFELSDNCTASIPKVIQNCPGYTPLPNAAVTVGVSPFSWTNNTGAPVNLYIQNGTVSQVLVNGLFTGVNATNAVVLVPALGVAKITYSGLPTVDYQGLL